MKITKSKINKAEKMLQRSWDNLKLFEEHYGLESEVYKRNLARWASLDEMFELLTK
jgi:hypothetical protein